MEQMELKLSKKHKSTDNVNFRFGKAKSNSPLKNSSESNSHKDFFQSFLDNSSMKKRRNTTAEKKFHNTLKFGKLEMKQFDKDK